MSVNRAAMLALLVGIVAGTAYGQAEPYGRPPGTQGQYDTHRRHPVDPYYNPYYDPQPYDRYDREQGPDVEVGFFYYELSPYGEWVRHPRYGWVWFPRHVRAGWRPYSLGRWVESDYGWMWVSDEPFGWATYHYGRWAWDPWVGWLWIPGTNWGPAWVAWQQGNGYIGWAPLPPEVGFEIGVGIRLGGFNLSFGIAPRDYAFVEERRFLHSRIDGYLVPQVRNTTIINNTRDITNYSVINNRVINHGVPIERIEQATGTRPQPLRVTTAPNPRDARVQRDMISIYRPTQSKLETVKVAPRNNAGLLQPAPLPNRPEVQPPTATPPEVAPIRQETGPVPIPVAPRTEPAQWVNKERQFQREQKDLKASQEKERRALEQIHRQEMAQAQAKANAQEVALRHAAELLALQEQRQRTEQQLQTRQQIERKAAQASTANAQRSAKPPGNPDKPKNEKKDDNQKPPPSF